MQTAFTVLNYYNIVIYRSKTEIISVILRTTNRGANKTKIMYNAFLSYSLMKKYISFLMENSLLVFDEKKHQYSVTEKGRRFLRMYDEINELLNSQLNKTHK